MTNFAIVFDPYAGTVKAESETHEKILGIISFIGIGLSLGGLFLTILTLLLFRFVVAFLKDFCILLLVSAAVLNILTYVTSCLCNI